MSAPTITDLGQREAACQWSDQLVQEAVEAERTAFDRWQDAYGAYEVACDEAAVARANWEQALIPKSRRPAGRAWKPRPAGRPAPPINSSGQEELS